MGLLRPAPTVVGKTPSGTKKVNQGQEREYNIDGAAAVNIVPSLNTNVFRSTSCFLTFIFIHPFADLPKAGGTQPWPLATKCCALNEQWLSCTE